MLRYIIILRIKNPLRGVILKIKKLDVLLLRIFSDTVFKSLP